ncbi:MAG: LPS export ABC transporter periplasmic protein LptC [Gammaproteobacteria bacterium]
MAARGAGAIVRRWLGRAAWIVLAAIAGLSSWLLIANHRGAPTLPAGAAAKQELPDYSLDHAVITRYAASGARRYVLDADRITHLLTSGTSVLSKVQLDYYPDSGPWWQLRAAQGTLARDGNRVALSGHVHVNQPTAADPMRLATSELEVLLAERRIRSTAHVTLWQGAREMQGIGLSADLQKGTVSLLKDVTSRYVQ